ncbi:OTU domain-containing protein 7B-like isoform X3 [Lineus longissimus]|uniref:OTU domain-containing protein 7B-like isoform X3 n=1 Tax=Lineus longissimus TaxID=88925 RepID=UPI00315DB394
MCITCFSLGLSPEVSFYKLKPWRRTMPGKNWDMDASRHAYYNLHHGRGDAQKKGQNQPPNSGLSYNKPPPLQKAYAIDDDAIPKKLKRGMSKTLDNMFLVDKAHNIVLSDVKESSFDHTNYFVETPEFTFMLPDLTLYSEDFRAFLEKDLIETSTLVSLEQAGRLNWWADIGACQRLLPLATSGDGNCLLHAASLGMWGFHDRRLTLRKALFNTMSNGENHGAIWRRWRWQQILFNREAQLIYSEEEWQNEWSSVLHLASAKPRSHPGRKNSCCDSVATRGGMERLSEEDSPLYESLEEIHVFVLAHVLRRPIVVVADVMLKDSNGEALAPIPFGGIYLPLDCDPKECHRSPLVLTYDAAHFSALVAMEMETSPDVKPRLPAVIPLIDPDFKVLPLHFDADPGPDFDWEKDEHNPDKTRALYLSSEQKLALLERYMDIKRVSIPKYEIDNLANSKESVNTNDSDECKSSSGSCESEDSVGNKEKSKVAKQMNTVAKQFGSIGKTMSKKLKKNFGGITKAMKSVTGSETPQLRTRRASVSGSQTQSTNLSVTVEMLKDKEHILCAKLSNKRAKYQEEMIKNYLHSAHERFECDRDIRRKRGSELKMKIEQKRLSRETIKGAPVQCITPGCNMFGTDETSYLCSSCFSRQKQEALNFQNSQGVQKDTKTNLVTIANSGSGGGHAGAIGRSKFFAGKEPVVLRKEPVAQSSNNLNNQVSSQTETLHLRNSTFYDGSRSPETRRSLPPDGGVQKLPPASGGNVLRRSTPESSPRIMRVQHQVQTDGNVVIPVVHTNQSPGHVQQRQPGVGRQSAPLTGYDNLDLQMKSQCNIVTPSQHAANEEPLQYCRSTGCRFYGSEQFGYLCSGCYKVKAKNQPAVETTYSRQTRL